MSHLQTTDVIFLERISLTELTNAIHRKVGKITDAGDELPIIPYAIQTGRSETSYDDPEMVINLTTGAENGHVSSKSQLRLSVTRCIRRGCFGVGRGRIHLIVISFEIPRGLRQWNLEGNN